MRRYEEKSGRLVCSVATTSLVFWWLVGVMCLGVCRAYAWTCRNGSACSMAAVWGIGCGVDSSRPRVGPRARERRQELLTDC
jgi:hypothetical protein